MFQISLSTRLYAQKSPNGYGTGLGYTLKNGNWFNMAEIELHVLTRQCLNRKIGEMETMKKEVGAWQRERNNKNL
jgi:hypothetical protein